MPNSKSSPQEEDTLAKVEEYTRFLDNVLRPELLEAKRQLEETQTEIQEYEQLRTTLKEQLPETTMVDLGYQAVRCQARIESPQTIFVHVGLGFHVEMDIPQALEFVDQRISFLKANPLEQRQKRYSQVGDHVQSSMNILSELEKVQKRM